MASKRIKRIPVFTAGQEDIIGVEDAREQYAQFREQNVVVTNRGRVVVVCQARNRSKWSDMIGLFYEARNHKDIKLVRLDTNRILAAEE